MIYGFRGATGDFILNFEKFCPGAEIIRLEQNYRSTKKIVQAANNLISYNIDRRGKKLWTEKQEGVDLTFNMNYDFDDECSQICEEIKFMHEKH